MLLSSAEIFEASLTNSVDPDQTSCRSSLIWVHTVCLYTYINQLTDIFGFSHFAGVLRVKSYVLCLYWGVVAQDNTVIFK